ncbi:MAG: DUF1566 domain-containing protein [Anaerolineaceae bacterium]|nr:DUF1566 domain-containing protein [Anaerolineaceae bacterium]
MSKKISTLLIGFCILAISLAACATSQDITPAVPAETESTAVQAVPTEEVVQNTVCTITYPIVETGQGICYDSDGNKITCPTEGEVFYGQDAQFTGNAFSFTDNGNGTITDYVTNLTWQQTPDSGNYSWDEAQAYCESLEIADNENWRMPSLKELFSISNFSTGWPYLDQTYFDLVENDSISKDEQYWANNYYVGKTAEGGFDAAFGVNHATGHIKAYPATVSGPMAKHVRCVSGESYGENQLIDNSDGTITDEATGLMWSQADSGEGMDWETALAYAQTQNAANYLGYSDWRLPNVKELQSIVNYDYAPDAADTTYDGPAIDPMFSVSEITNEAGNADYPYYWTSTSARFQSGGDFYYAWYVAAGRAVNNEGVDYHGAGAVRFDTKEEDGPAAEGGERYYNYVRLVRGGEVAETPDGDPNANDTSTAMTTTDSAPNGQDNPEQGNPAEQQPDMSAAAITLGVTEDALKAALGDPSQGQPNFDAAAQTLGVTEAELMAALGLPQQ